MSKRDAVVTVGSFDGVHAGHRMLLQEVVKVAKRTNSKSVVLTFDPHPREVVMPEKSTKLLTPPHEKEILLQKIGIFEVVTLIFSSELATMTGEDFISRILVEQLGMNTFVVGYDNHFGRDGAGTIELARRLGSELGFEVVEIAQLGKISSTRIREAVSEGNMALAAELLGEPYSAMVNIDSCCVTLPDCRKLMPVTGCYNISIGNMENILNIDTMLLDAPVNETSAIITFL